MSIQCSRLTVPRGTHLAVLKRRSSNSTTFSLYYPYLTAYIWWTCGNSQYQSVNVFYYRGNVGMETLILQL